MNIVAISSFRNSAGPRLMRYSRQISNFAQALFKQGDRFRVICAEGDSTDHTKKMLRKTLVNHLFEPQIIDVSHGGPVFGSTEEPARMEALTKVVNGAFRHVQESDHIVFYVESDLLWDEQTAVSLVNQVKEGLDIVAPLIFAGEHFYDVFAYRGKDGERFSPFPPYHSALKADGLTEVNSVGSCFAAKGEIVRQIRAKENALIGWCDEARKAGYKISVDARLKVQHPA